MITYSTSIIERGLDFIIRSLRFIGCSSRLGRRVSYQYSLLPSEYEEIDYTDLQFEAMETVVLPRFNIHTLTRPKYRGGQPTSALSLAIRSAHEAEMCRKQIEMSRQRDEIRNLPDSKLPKDNLGFHASRRLVQTLLSRGADPFQDLGNIMTPLY